MYIIKVLLFLCLVLNSNEISTPEDDHYVAAVVEYNVDRDVAANKEKYAELTRQAAQQNADIVVFPELTLTNNSVAFAVPIHSLLREYPIPALQPTLYDELFVAMSAAARDNNIYLVINVRELMDCTTETGETCPEAKQYIFNTNVVFDRTGAVIDRYRKINLFGEYSHTAAFQPDLGVFTTDFGVTFGHFICFDLMFQVPAVQVVQKNNIRNVIFPTMWFSELPYLTAVEIQQAYAYAMDVNFLGAGANRVAAGSAGSGIYSGKAGALISTMPGVDVTRLLVATVPKVPGQVTWPVPGPIYDNASDHDGLRLIVDPSLASHVSRLLEDGAQEFSLTDGDVTCTFKVRMSQREGESGVWYRAFVQDGSNTYARREVGVAACSVVACKTADIKTCGYKFNETEKRLIQELEIQMRTISNSYNRTLKCDNTKYFPLSLNTNKLPLNNKNFTFTITSSIKTDQCKEEEENTIFQNYLIDGKRETISFKINMPQDELVGFGVWGRIFNRDVDHNKEITDEDRRKFNTLWDNIYGV